MITYHNPETDETAKINSEKADKDGNVWVQIDGDTPKLMNYNKFIKNFNRMLTNDQVKKLDEK